MRFSATAIRVLLMAGSPGVALAAGDMATAGPVTTVQATAMTDAQVQQKLQSEGYTNIQVTKHEGDHIDVKATKNGKAEKLAVNPQTGAVMPETDRDDD